MSSNTHRDAFGRTVRESRRLDDGIPWPTPDTSGMLPASWSASPIPSERVWTYGYDALGRRISVDDPDLGVLTYQYDVADRVTSQKDANRSEITFTYDALSRVTKKRARTKARPGGWRGRHRLFLRWRRGGHREQGPAGAAGE